MSVKFKFSTLDEFRVEWPVTVSVPQDGGGVVYRLFRRDMRRALHAELCNFHSDCTRQLIAKTLRAARHRLRNTVDEIDLQIMGVTQ